MYQTQAQPFAHLVSVQKCLVPGVPCSAATEKENRSAVGGNRAGVLHYALRYALALMAQYH